MIESKATRMLKAATDNRLSESERAAAIGTLREMAQGAASGRECAAAREALAQLGEKQEHPVAPVAEGLEAELIRETRTQRLGDVAYGDIHSFCSVRHWDAGAHALYDKWVWSNEHASGVVLKAYLALHFGARSTAKHLISNAGKPWPYHNCNVDAVKRFLESGPGCKDAETVCREFLATGHVTKLPEECECWRLTRAIERAYDEKNPQILFDELSKLLETHLAAA